MVWQKVSDKPLLVQSFTQSSSEIKQNIYENPFVTTVILWIKHLRICHCLGSHPVYVSGLQPPPLPLLCLSELAGFDWLSFRQHCWQERFHLYWRALGHKEYLCVLSPHVDWLAGNSLCPRDSCLQQYTGSSAGFEEEWLVDTKRQFKLMPQTMIPSESIWIQENLPEVICEENWLNVCLNRDEFIIKFHSNDPTMQPILQMSWLLRCHWVHQIVAWLDHDCSC